MQVSTLQTEVSIQADDILFRFQIQESGKRGFAQLRLRLRDLIAYGAGSPEMRTRDPPLCEVHELGNRRMRLRWYQEERCWENTWDGRSLRILSVSEDRRRNLVNDTPTLEFSPFSRQKKKVGGLYLIYYVFGSLNLQTLDRNVTLNAHAQRASWPRAPQSVSTTRRIATHQDNTSEPPAQSG